MKVRLFLVFWLVLFLSNFSQAAYPKVEVIPESWILENYVGDNDNVKVWNSGSSCSGKLQFPSNSTQGDIDRFWSTVLAAKLAGRKIFVYYIPGECNIKSFGMVQ
ncbi:hypothetical protein [Teredinibacter sp. KSP-S5-2]|uniref:hypothetical protein n=1 Tax=Teredinibacter sp. KSP-S5-2 TaxID=3034506 RepID=UPI00293502E0|nr:hypothetical protein [Teredinibacter sp. KSP-S5-2]WNO10316.1 hypothetical protein P5V12_03930 [Teredinibacter sp. KSP-S5-2]